MYSSSGSFYFGATNTGGVESTFFQLREGYVRFFRPLKFII
jgi:hypothetical protein